MVRADRQQPGELPLTARVRLERHGRVPGDGGEPLGEVTDQLQITGGLVERGERVDVGEVRPGHRRHLGCRVELHRAGPKRDHATVQREVLVRELAYVTQHRRFGTVLVEHRMAQIAAGTRQLRRNRLVATASAAGADAGGSGASTGAGTGSAVSAGRLRSG